MSLDVYLNPPACPHCGKRDEGWSANITHNLGAMAEAAGIYKAVWRPEELGYFRARHLIKPLRAGIAAMLLNPAKFKKFNPPNGWGSYDDFIPWLERYLQACEENPEWELEVSR